MVPTTRVQICTACGTGKLDPLPDSVLLNAHYMSDEYQRWMRHGDCKYKLEPLPDSRALSQYNSITLHFDFKNIHNILDFGAGSASTMRTIKLKYPHISTTAIELSKAFRKLLSNCNEITEVYAEIPSDLPSQDLIIISETLEHILDPIGIIKRFRSLLTTKGYLFIEVPNCPFPYYYENKEYHYPHTFFFTKDSIIQIAANYGFEIVYMNSLGMDIRTWSKTPDIHKIVKQTGFSYEPNEHGIHLRVLLRKTNGKLSSL